MAKSLNPTINPTPQELGFPFAPATMPVVLPYNEGLPSVPPFMAFSQLVNTYSRTFLTYDEASRQGRDQALACRRDPTIFEALRARQMPVSQLQWHVAAEDPNDVEQASVAEAITKGIRRMPRFQQFLMCQLEAIWYGKAGCQIAWQWDWVNGMKIHRPRQWWPVNGDKIVFRFDGTPGVLVHATYPGSWVPTQQGRAHFLDGNERATLCVHQHEPEDPDFYEGDLASGLFGVGLRSRVFWYWYLKTQTMQFLMDYIERFGSGGTTIYFYEAGNKDSLEEMSKVASSQFGNNVLLLPRYRDNPNGGPGIDRFEPSASGVQLVQNLITTYFDDTNRRLILGQDLTSTTSPTGLGSGVAALHGETFSRIISYDAINLQESLSLELVAPMQRFMGKGHLPPCKFMFEVDAPNTQTILGAAQAFFELGGAVDEEKLREAVGLPAPEPGKAILSKQQMMSPQSAGTIPAGVPMQGPPSPDPNQQGLAPPQGAAMPPQAAPPEVAQ
jgi:hypothetical protein